MERDMSSNQKLATLICFYCHRPPVSPSLRFTPAPVSFSAHHTPATNFRSIQLVLSVAALALFAVPFI